VTLPQVEDRIPEKIFWRDFLLAQPGIIGGLLDAVRMALGSLEHVNVPPLPRMADFARWICAAAPALPFDQEEFLQAYRDNRRESVSLSIETSSVAASIQALVV
jgi:putative DNA primase/helicase